MISPRQSWGRLLVRSVGQVGSLYTVETQDQSGPNSGVVLFQGCCKAGLPCKVKWLTEEH